MGIPTSPPSSLLLLLLSLFTISFSPPTTSAADLFTLVYKGCANQTFTSGGGGAASQASIAAVSSSLAAQSSASKFFKTTSSGLFGLFQCRGDLAGGDCAACVSRAFPAAVSLCPAAVAARVQLAGCLVLYQSPGFPQVPGTQLLFKTCSSGGGAGGDFEVRRDTALAAIQSGVSSNGGFFATSYRSVYAMAQCEGDLSAGDCGECVAQAVQKSEVECGGAASGQVYLDKCYISYSYYSNGVSHSSGFGKGQQTGKTVAIVVGGAAGLGFLVILLLFGKSLLKKKDDY